MDPQEYIAFLKRTDLGYQYSKDVTDLGVDRGCTHQGIGSRLMHTALELAGGEKNIAVYLIANDHVEWTSFAVECITMIEKYFAIDPSLAQRLVAQAARMQWAKRGIDRRAYLIDDYAVLATDRMKLRNVTTRDNDFHYLDAIIESLLRLHQCGVAVVPILGYCCEPDSADGTGFIIQKRAKGSELFDDAILARFQVWAQAQPENVYLHSSTSEIEGIHYLLTRASAIANIPQAHFNKFVSDMAAILQQDILIDDFGKSNFFYDTELGFQFIDLDAHNDYRYGLTDQAPNIEETLSISGFVPCLYASGTKYFSAHALDEQALLALTPRQQRQLADANSTTFQKCLAALKQNGISTPCLNKTLSMMKFYGVE